MPARFRHEDVSAVPRGWKVRTVTHERHRVRVAFPPGRREKGSGRLVSILHPIGENPCTLRSANPAELLVMGANPPRRRSHLPKARVETYQLVSKITGKPIRKATRVIFEDGRKVDFIERLPKTAAIRAAADELRINPGMELVVMGANPPAPVRPAPNPPHVHTAAPDVTAEAHEAGNNPGAAEIFEGFTGRESEWVTVTDEPHMPRGDYAQLGDLLNLYVKPLAGAGRTGSERQILEIRFKDRICRPIVVCDRSARQIYFVGGDQDIDGTLDRFGAVGISGGRFRLGEGVRIDYRARKDHVAEPDEDKWKHYFGEENGAKPKVLFDSRLKRLLLEGGDYRIDGAWIRN